MAKKNCDFESNIVNGGKAGLAGFLFGMAASFAKRLRKSSAKRRSTSKTKKD